MCTMATDWGWDLGWGNEEMVEWGIVLGRLRADGKVCYDGFGEERGEDEGVVVREEVGGYLEVLR